VSAAPEVVTVAPRLVAVVRRQVAVGQVSKHIISWFDLVYAQVRAGKVRQQGHNVALYRPASTAGMLDVECGVEVGARFEAAGEVVCSEIPGGRVIHSIHIGPYHLLGQTYDAAASFARREGLRQTGVNWEIYGDWNEDPARLRTDVFQLLEPS
jgi:effector-binding domain-containing protein